MTCRWPALLLFLTACTGPGEIVVDLRTDLVPGIEVTGVETSLDDGPPVAHVPNAEGDYLRGVRIASFASVEPGTHRLEVRLVRGTDEVVVRPVTVRVEGTTGVTVVITRDCQGVTCPAAAGNPMEVACLGGMCVDPSCTPETPEACPVPACTVDADCPVSELCTTSACVEGVCLNSECGTTTGPFGPATLVAPLSGVATDDDPSATGDLLELFFSSNRAGGAGADDLWVATRTRPDDDFAAPEPVAALNTPDNETAPELSSDGLTIVFVSSRPGLGARDIYMSSRSSRTTPWDPPTIIDVVSTPDDETAPTFDGSLLRLIYNNRAAGNEELWEAARDTTSQSFRPPVPIAEVDESGPESAPHLDASGLTLYFGARRASEGRDILRASRPTLDDPFGPAEILTELQTSSDETDPWVSPDGRTIYFSSTRDGVSQIYTAER